MATWIVHLRLAEALVGQIGGLDEAAFALGNIAPDSGIPDEHWEKFTPSPEVTHFAGGTSDGSLADLYYIKAMYQRHDAEVEAAYRQPYIYLSQSEVDRFVAGAGQQLYRIHQCLWIDHANPNGFSSALELIKILPQESQP